MEWGGSSHGWRLRTYLQRVKSWGKDSVQWAGSCIRCWIQKNENQQLESHWARCAVAVAVAEVASALAEGASGVTVAAG